MVQFSVKHEQGIDCGGGCVKLFPDTLNQEDMHSESEYYIMFGKRSDSSHCQLCKVFFFFFLLCPVLLVAQSLFQDAGYFSCCMHDHFFFSFSVVAFNSVQFSCSVVSDSFRPHGLQHIRLPCPSPTPGACSNSCASSW